MWLLPRHNASSDQCLVVSGGVLWGFVGCFGWGSGCIVVFVFLVIFLSLFTTSTFFVFSLGSFVVLCFYSTVLCTVCQGVLQVVHDVIYGCYQCQNE